MSISKKVSSIVNLLKEKKNKQINKIKTQYQQIFDFDQSQRKIHTCLVIIIQFRKKKFLKLTRKKKRKERNK